MGDQRLGEPHRWPSYETTRDKDGHLRTEDGRRVLTPRRVNGRRVEVALSPEEEIAWDHAWRIGVAAVEVTLPDGMHASLRRADCGHGCYCDAIILPDFEEVADA